MYARHGGDGACGEDRGCQVRDDQHSHRRSCGSGGTGGRARLPHHIDEVIAAVDRVALAVAKRLQRLYGPFAEVGIDLALRKSGEVVVFEVNPTPGRRMLRSLPGNIREMSLHCLVEYAIRANGISAGSHQ